MRAKIRVWAHTISLACIQWEMRVDLRMEFRTRLVRIRSQLTIVPMGSEHVRKVMIHLTTKPNNGRQHGTGEITDVGLQGLCFHSHIRRIDGGPSQPPGLLEYAVWSLGDSLYLETLHHCANAMGPLCRHVAYALLVHHVVQADGPHLQTQIDDEGGVLLLVHQEP